MYWAHSRNDIAKDQWQPLKVHLLEVAEKAREFASAFGGQEFAWVAGLCHDIGKYSAEFQLHLEDPMIRVDHSTAGARLAAARYGSLGRLIAYVVAGHHCGLPNGGDDAAEGSLLYRISRKDIVDYSAYRYEVELPSNLPKLTVKPHPHYPGFSVAFFTRMLFSCVVDADYLDTEGFMNPEMSQHRTRSYSISELEKRLTEYMQRKMANVPVTHVNRVRAQVLEDCLAAAKQKPGLFTLTVPTGGGKTLSSLAFALKHAVLHGLERVIYVIPFTSIIEQNAQIFREAVGADAVLEHHSNVVSRSRSLDDDGNIRLELAEENWDMPLIVTTNVQFFESLFSNKSSRCRKLHNIARSVIILDEAQMLPVELLKPCVAALEELVRNYGASVVLCSATQPALNKLFSGETVVREIASDPRGLQVALKRVEVANIGTLSDETVAKNMMEHEQVLCIVNTRAHARNLFERLGSGNGHFHLSAGMCPVHRARRLAEIRARLSAGKSCRVVSTQLIEAGVDVDFPVVFRAIAGIDSIAQAAGRCNREGKLTLGKVFVFSPEGKEGMSHVWFKRTASIAASLLDEEIDPLSLVAIQRYFSDLYFYEGEQLDAKDIMSMLETGAKSLNFPFEQVADVFKVIGDDTFGIVVPFDDQCRNLLSQVDTQGISRTLARRLQPYTVSVRAWEFERLRDKGALEDRGGLAVLRDMKLYDDKFGLIPPDVKDTKIQGGDVWIV
ncbi:MAG TPA: CRISPR-associated helicase Cas3' [Firmicutes bacterium]|nr:CRISPR-associated helicase Cas3' [Candidatus Fermentithermobacillaceae bacterium]